MVSIEMKSQETFNWMLPKRKTIPSALIKDGNDQEGNRI
jgi:hypothetical protein